MNNNNFTIDTVLRRSRQIGAALIASLASFSLGCCLGWSAPCIEILRSDVYGFKIEADVIASVFPLSAAFGTIIVPLLFDRIGRKWTLMVLMPAFIGGWILLIIAAIHVIFGLFVLGRIMTGACGGMFCVLVPMYSAEISEKQIRGTTGVFFQLLLVIGILYVYITGFVRNVVVISCLCTIPPVLFVLLMSLMPESPLFYLIKEQEDKARQAMLFFRGADFDIEPEISDFKKLAETSRRATLNLSAFLEWSMLRTLGLAYGLMFAQQFSGINAVIFYGVTIFEATEVEMDSLVQMVIFGVVQVISCLIVVALIDQLGRKKLMAFSAAVMCICLLALATFFVIQTHWPEKMDKLHWLPLTAVCVYILAFCLGSGPIPWTYMGEIFPTRLKGTASSSAAFFNWLLAFVITMSFPSAVDSFGNAPVLFFFALICFLTVFFVIFFMVETKHKTFIEIRREFGDMTAT